MKDERIVVTFWYIEPMNAHTNSVLAQNLSEGDACRDKLCGDGKSRHLWRCRHLEVLRFQEERETMKLRFRVFVQKGPYGKIRKWLFGVPKQHAKRKEEVPF